MVFRSCSHILHESYRRHVYVVSMLFLHHLPHMQSTSDLRCHCMWSNLGYFLKLNSFNIHIYSPQLVTSTALPKSQAKPRPTSQAWPVVLWSLGHLKLGLPGQAWAGTSLFPTSPTTSSQTGQGESPFDGTQVDIWSVSTIDQGAIICTSIIRTLRMSKCLFEPKNRTFFVKYIFHILLKCSCLSSKIYEYQLSCEWTWYWEGTQRQDVPSEEGEGDIPGQASILPCGGYGGWRRWWMKTPSLT